MAFADASSFRRCRFDMWLGSVGMATVVELSRKSKPSKRIWMDSTDGHVLSVY